MGSKRSRRTATHLTREQCIIFGLMIAMAAVAVAPREPIPGLYRRHLLGRRARLGGVHPSKHPQAKEGDTHVYFHPESQRTFYLRFTDEGLTGYHSTHGPDDVRIPAAERRSWVLCF
ncbi:hypothetical protein HQ563_03785 [bacterium]|nr:hypothetical protein [bacterium]